MATEFLHDWTVYRLASFERENPAAEHERSPHSIQRHTLSDLQMLRQAADLGEQQKRRASSFCKELIIPQVEVISTHAEPLHPLRERDHAVLATWFQTENMLQIEADISQMLLRFFPEPCWEEDPFELLREFL